jgi:hypothetical protein
MKRIEHTLEPGCQSRDFGEARFTQHLSGNDAEVVDPTNDAVEKVYSCRHRAVNHME